MSNKYTIEKLTKDCNYKEFLKLLEELTTVHAEEITYEDFCKHYDNLKAEIYIVKTENKIVATASILIEPKFIHKLGYVAHIEDVVVTKTVRSTGLGKMIISKLISIAKENKCYKIILNCSEQNVGFYEKCGFKKHSSQMVYRL